MRALVNTAIAAIRIGLLLAIAVLGVGCAELPPQLEGTRQAISRTLSGWGPHPTGYWDPDHYRGTPRIVVHLDAQRAYFYRGKHVIGESTISTGRKGYETPPGRYRVIQKDRDHISSEYGDYITRDGEIVMRNISVKEDPKPKGTIFDGAKMPYFLRFTGGYGMHAGYVPRYRASHGCIRMPAKMARHFFEAAEEGTPVIVKEE
jgi:lipoprotein-anchoring transpeptidase ErfK/SrfK